MFEIKGNCCDCDQPFTYQKTRLAGRKKVRCESCAKKHKEASAKARMDRYRERNGQRVGVGSGGNQWGEHNAQWKNGTSKKYYRRLCFEAHGYACHHCGWSPSKPSEMPSLLAHHIDEDRTNNAAENLRPVCKACHQNTEHPTPRDSKGRYCRNKIAE